MIKLMKHQDLPHSGIVVAWTSKFDSTFKTACKWKIIFGFPDEQNLSWKSWLLTLKYEHIEFTWEIFVELSI